MSNLNTVVVSQPSVNESGLKLDLTNLMVWTPTQKKGRQGDVVIIKLPDNSPLLDKGHLMSATKKLDRVLAKGSRASHTAEGATVYDLKNGRLLVVAHEPWTLYHHDTLAERHHPQQLPAGGYTTHQQIEETPQGVKPVAD